MAASNCDEMSKYLKPLSFHLGNHEFELSPNAYLVKGKALDALIGDTCIIGIQRLPEMGPQADQIIILGDVFLRHFYTVLNTESQNVMLGVKKRETEI
jgi:hypothetical protein